MTNVLSPAAGATLHYEAVMAGRGRALWLATLPLLALAALVAALSPPVPHQPISAEVGSWALLINLFGALGPGIALADRLGRTRRLGLADLLAATPTSPTGRLAAALTGALAVALAPAAAAILSVGVIVAFTRQDLAGVVWALLALVAVILPGALLLVTFAAALGAVLPLPAARVLAVIAWFWLTVFNTHLIPIPTLTGTVISPLGDYVIAGWMHGQPLWAGRGAIAALSPAPAGLTAAISLVAVLIVTVGLLLLARAEILRTADRHA